MDECFHAASAHGCVNDVVLSVLCYRSNERRKRLAHASRLTMKKQKEQCFYKHCSFISYGESTASYSRFLSDLTTIH